MGITRARTYQFCHSLGRKSFGIRAVQEDTFCIYEQVGNLCAGSISRALMEGCPHVHDYGLICLRAFWWQPDNFASRRFSILNGWPAIIDTGSFLSKKTNRSRSRRSPAIGSHWPCEDESAAVVGCAAVVDCAGAAAAAGLAVLLHCLACAGGLCICAARIGSRGGGWQGDAAI